VLSTLPYILPVLKYGSRKIGNSVWKWCFWFLVTMLRIRACQRAGQAVLAPRRSNLHYVIPLPSSLRSHSVTAIMMISNWLLTSHNSAYHVLLPTLETLIRNMKTQIYALWRRLWNPKLQVVWSGLWAGNSRRSPLRSHALLRIGTYKDYWHDTLAVLQDIELFSCFYSTVHKYSPPVFVDSSTIKGRPIPTVLFIVLLSTNTFIFSTIAKFKLPIT